MFKPPKFIIFHKFFIIGVTSAFFNIVISNHISFDTTTRSTQYSHLRYAYFTLVFHFHPPTLFRTTLMILLLSGKISSST